MPARRQGLPGLTRQEVGAAAERVVADYLDVRGFTLLGHNVRAGHLEVDLLAQRGPLVVIVEVRARGPRSHERPLASITATKRTRLLRAVDRLWRTRFSREVGVERIRIDVAAVDLTAGAISVEYIEGAIVAGFNARM